MYRCNAISGEVAFLVISFEGNSLVPDDVFVKFVMSGYTEFLFL